MRRRIPIIILGLILWPLLSPARVIDLSRLPPATVLSGPSNTVTATLQHDMDVHAYSFSIKPWTFYAIAVTTGTVWDVSLALIPPTPVASPITTNTVWGQGVVYPNRYHEGALARWQLAVAGMFAFTTGTYHLSVWELPGQDTDADGFPDAWEMHYFGNLHTATPADLNQFNSGRPPNNPLAVERVEPAQSAQDADRIRWSVAPYGTYDLFTTTNLFSGWAYVGTHIAGANAATVIWTNAATGSPRAFYHLLFRTE